MVTNMNNESITPINHGYISSATTTVAGGASGGFWGTLKGALVGGAIVFGLCVGLGAVFGVTSAIAALPAIATGLTAKTFALTYIAPIALGALQGAASWVGWGLFGGLTVGAFGGAAIGGMTGLGTGTLEGINRVGQEKGAALQLQTQIEAYKAQAATMEAMAKTGRPANDNKFGFPPQGDAMNLAPTNIKVGTENAQLQGAVASGLQQQQGM